MRVPLIKDSSELATMAYWSKDRLESIHIKNEFSIVTLETSNVTLETSNVTLETSNVTLETSNVISKLTKPIQFYDTTLDAQCFVTRYEDGCCFVFRGTTNIRDWMINADVGLDHLFLPNVKRNDCPNVHGGFLRQFQSLERTLMTHANEYIVDPTIQESNRTFYYIGHSLGGALATITATVFGALYPDARHVCITFGSPRVGDSNFVREFTTHCDESVRSVNQEDPVPFIPSSCRYTHVPGLVFFDSNEELHRTIVENRIVNACKDSFLCCCGLAENPVDDHDMDQYIQVWKKI